MDVRWTKGLTGKAKESRVSDVRSFARAFEELDTILASLYKSPILEYDSGWEYKQVAVNEFNRSLDSVRKLLKVSN